MSPLYAQCVRCVLVPLTKAKLKLKDPLERIKKSFQISDEFHAKHVEEIQPSYSKKNLLAFLQWQLEHLSEHPLYTKESFETGGKDAYDNWLQSEKTRLSKLIEKQKDEKKKDEKEEKDDVEFEVEELEGIESEGCPFYHQLFVSLISFDRNSIMVDEAADQRINAFVLEVTSQVVASKAEAPLNIDALFPNHLALELLISISPFTTWLLDEYAERFGIGQVYRQITHLAYLAPNLRHNMRQMILTHVVISRTFDLMKKPHANYNLAELQFFKDTVKRLWKDVRLNFLSNIIRYFSSSNLPSMTMMIKLLVLLSEVVAWLKKKSNKPFQFQYKTGMRELILVPHFRFPSLFSSHTSS